MKKFAVAFGEYNEKLKKKATDAIVSTKGIVFFSMDMKSKKFIVIGDVDQDDLVSKLKKLGDAELQPIEGEEKQRIRKMITKSCKFIVGVMTTFAAGYGVFRAVNS